MNTIKNGLTYVPPCDSISPMLIFSLCQNHLKQLPDFMDSDNKSVMFWVLESSWTLHFIPDTFSLSST